MSNNNKNTLDMGNPRPSVKSEKKGFVVATPKTKKPKKQRGQNYVSKHSNAESKQVSSVISANKPETKISSAKKFMRTSIKKKNEERQAKAKEKNKARSTQRQRKDKNIQNAKVLSRSLNKKTEKDVKVKGFNFGTMSASLKKGIIFGIIALIVVLIGIAVGFFVFVASTNAKLSIDDSAKGALIKPQENQPSYILFSADLDATQDGNPDMLILARADIAQKSFIVISIPVDTFVASAAGGGTTLANICKENNDAALINAVSTFSELSISHYIKINAEGLTKMVDTLGGIDVDINEYVDDPNAGSAYISSGKSTINGDQALTLLRSKKFSGGSDTVQKNQLAVAVGLAKAVFNNTSANMAMMVDQLAGDIKTDMSTIDCINFVNSVADVSDENFKTASVPGYNTLRNNNLVFVIDASAWKYMRTQISYGVLVDKKAEKTVADINPSQVSVYVRNGAGIDGAGAMVADKLKAVGFDVVNTDNAEINSYKETLIVYKNAEQKDNAEAIKNALNNGRLVNGEGLYNMTTDIMVIIGGDYKV